MSNCKGHIKTEDLIHMYTVQHLSTCEIQKLVGMSRTGIMKRLKQAGITADKGEWVNEICAFCGTEYRIMRCLWKKSKQHYCKKECYYASRENEGYKPWRQGQRLARAIVAQYIHLSPDHVVHHKDGNNRNNNIDNLIAYASQSDHLKAHHGNHVQVVWDGANPYLKP